MIETPQQLPQLSRRELLKHFGFASALLISAPFACSVCLGGEPREALGEGPFWAGERYIPHYPSRSPLDDILRLVIPGADGYPTEAFAAEITTSLAGLSEGLRSGDPSRIQAGIGKAISPAARSGSLLPGQESRSRAVSGIDSFHGKLGSAATSQDRLLSRELADWIDPQSQVEHLNFEITAIEQTGADPLTVRTVVRYALTTLSAENRREGRSGTWTVVWVRAPDPPGAHWQATSLHPETADRSTAPGDGFVDVTEAAMGATSSYRAQLMRGVDDWRSRLDGACGIDVYGNNGIAAGDFNNDGFDDLYVSQPAGLPNRLYRNRGDGSFEDVTEQAGVGVLDNTACALFADLRNVGLQDLLVVCGGGPLLFLNGGDGTFTLKRDAFHFTQPPQGTFTHAAIADYDGDGRLDVYFCLYSYYLGLDQYHYPAPYFDARNGPPNFLFHNEGDATFADRTAAAGLNADNDRYSFACAWGDSGENKLPDLYVVNDFGRNNFYRSNGDGTFRSAAQEAHVEDVGAGMSASWGAVSNGGRSDLYVANMWSAAGLRVSQQPEFHAGAPASVRELYRRHASGNALYRNGGDGRFANVSEQAGVARGGWAWCSDFWDFDHDGYQDLYITNGYITAPESRTAAPAAPDLASFFWRQVVGRSPEDATPSLAYERGWNALNELIRSDASWSGHERNVALANNHDGTFSDVSGALRLDFLEDGRSFALADLDGDGRLELILKSRNAPQLRIVHNALPELGDAITFRLRGVHSNRDAIGTTLHVTSGALQQTRSLQAGTGFLAQHSKELHFGLGKGTDLVDAEVRWPSGLIQHFKGLPRNSRVGIEEGKVDVTAKPFAATTPAYRQGKSKQAVMATPSQTATIETWLLDPLAAPAFSLPDLHGKQHTLEALRGRMVLLHLWSVQSAGFREQLQSLERGRRTFVGAALDLLAINFDGAEAAAAARSAVAGETLSYPVLFATDEVAGIYNIVYRYLFDRRANLALPTSLLLDRSGMIVKIYQGPVTPGGVLGDAASVPSTGEERRRKALPFPGTLLQTEFSRNDFTYGVAMFQHGYFDQAAASFQQVVAARPEDAEAHYNLGTLNLRRNNFPEARRYLERTLQLKPNYPEAWNNLGMMAAQGNDNAEAITDFQQSLALRPTYATALLNLGNVYRRQKDFPQAQAALSRALGLQPDDPEANYSMGMLLAQGGQLPEAATYLRKAIELRPDYPEARNNLGVLLVRAQRYDEAEQQFTTCIRLVPDFDQSYLNLARLYLVERQTEKAKATLGDLLRRKPDNAAARQGLVALGEAP